LGIQNPAIKPALTDSYSCVAKRAFEKNMGESKRRKAALGEKYGQETQIFPWLPITKRQAQQVVDWSNRIAKIGIGLLVVSWVTVRFLGPAVGWWQVVN
jgi:hypothetical protein